MTHWTSILFYLWKNTFKRWLENPFPALVKILIPALLAALGVVALAMFAQIERELRFQLQRSSALSVQVVEYVQMDEAASMMLRTEADELMWSSRFGADNIKFTSKIFSSARMANTQATRPIPIFSKQTPRTAGAGEVDPQDLPVVELLFKRETYAGTKVISLGGLKMRAVTGTMPQWIGNLARSKQVVLIPEDMARTMKRSGYVHYMLADFTSIAEVEQFVTEVTAYTQADGRQVTVASAMHILRELERIQGIQDVVRRLLVAGCCLVLALTLGSIAWLEYRQDSYLLALLRSFGTPAWVLFLHSMSENLILVMLGILSVLAFWETLYELILGNIQMVGFEVLGAPSLPMTDVWLIVGGGLAGVLLAMLPIAFGLKKPAGLTLQ